MKDGIYSCPSTSACPGTTVWWLGVRGSVLPLVSGKSAKAVIGVPFQLTTLCPA